MHSLDETKKQFNQLKYQFNEATLQDHVNDAHILRILDQIEALLKLPSENYTLLSKKERATLTYLKTTQQDLIKEYKQRNQIKLNDIPDTMVLLDTSQDSSLRKTIEKSNTLDSALEISRNSMQ